MQTNLPYPTFRNSPRILDIRQTLKTSPAAMQDITCANPSAPNRWLSLRACAEHVEAASIPPLSFLLLADRLGELYEMVFPDHPEWLDEEVIDWESEEAVAGAAERFLNRVSVLFPVHDDIWDVDLDIIEWRLWRPPKTRGKLFIHNISVNVQSYDPVWKLALLVDSFRLTQQLCPWFLVASNMRLSADYP